MSHERRTNLALSRSIAAALAVAGVWIGLHAQGVDGRTVAGLILLGLSVTWVVQVHLVERAAAQRG